jgi:hypothetical protein
LCVPLHFAQVRLLLFAQGRLLRFAQDEGIAPGLPFIEGKSLGCAPIEGIRFLSLRSEGANRTGGASRLTKFWDKRAN